MQIRPATRIVGVALPLLFALINAPAVGAQARDTTMKHRGAMPRANGTMGMMSGPHHALAMAYGETLTAFARALNIDAKRSVTIDVELARPATAEMRRSFDQMKLHHQAQMGAMGSAMSMNPDSMARSRSARRDSMMGKSMPAHATKMMSMDDMQAQMTTIETHLAMLESEVNAPSPNAANVIAHTNEILKGCGAMMRMPANSDRGLGRPAAH